MRRSMHIGGERPLRLRAVAENAFVAEEVFNPDAAKTDGNPFPEETKETVEEVLEDIHDYNSMTVEELKALLRARGLEVTGKKAELIARLLDADTPSEEAVEAEEVVPSEEAATSDEGVSENNGTDSGIEQSLGE
tara:strand:+ start:6251 stop:6655 length:405 start_codon:yes stop_codon:yes gene_type:complete